MITYRKIGHFGRLANQMFQFASTYGIAKKLGYEVAFPIENVTNPSVERFLDGITREVYFDLPNVFQIDKLLLSNDQIKTEYEVNEPHFHFSERLFSIPDGCNLNGYYQSEKYFKHCESDIRDLLTFKENIVSKALDIYSKIKSETVSIHVRVGDYAGQQQYHPICSSEYYEAAISYFFNSTPYTFLIFSDDIEYCKNIFQESENVLYIENNSPEVDMCLMSMCNHNIIANSSFSWWAAWLNNNQNKKVIAPKKWFGEAYYFHNTNDLYPENWILE